jgi:integrase
LRAGEIGALRWKRIDLLGGSVEVTEDVGEVAGHGLVFGPTKTYARRRVPLPRFLADELAGYQPHPYDAEALVFTGPDGGPLRHRNFYGCHFRPAIAQAGLPDGLRFHDLRHTYAALLIAEGAHARALMERMGHSSITVTLNTYGHLLPGLEAHLTDALDARGRAARDEVSRSVRSRGGHAGVRQLRTVSTASR